MDIENLTIKQARELAGIFGGPQKKTHSLRVGAKVFIRSVTMHYTGRIVSVTDSDISLEDAAWIASSGRFANALRTGELSEVEPYPDGCVCVVSRDAIVDWCDWSHELPREQK